MCESLRELTKSEAELIKGIFEECDSEYCGGKIFELPEDEEIKKIFEDLKLSEEFRLDYSNILFKLEEKYGEGFPRDVLEYITFKLMAL